MESVGNDAVAAEELQCLLSLFTVYTESVYSCSTRTFNGVVIKSLH